MAPARAPGWDPNKKLKEIQARKGKKGLKDVTIDARNKLQPVKKITAFDMARSEVQREKKEGKKPKKVKTKGAAKKYVAPAA